MTRMARDGQVRQNQRCIGDPPRADIADMVIAVQNLRDLRVQQMSCMKRDVRCEKTELDPRRRGSARRTFDPGRRVDDNYRVSRSAFTASAEGSDT